MAPMVYGTGEEPVGKRPAAWIQSAGWSWAP